jgi:DNA-binding MarR family transcriptional regulator
MGTTQKWLEGRAKNRLTRVQSCTIVPIIQIERGMIAMGIEVHNLLAGTEYLRRTIGDIELPQVILLSTLATQHPKALTHLELSDRTGLSRSAISRILKNWERRERGGVDVGLGLVMSRPDPLETRKLSVTLSEKGFKLMDAVARIMANPGEQRRAKKAEFWNKHGIHRKG